MSLKNLKISVIKYLSCFLIFVFILFPFYNFSFSQNCSYVRGTNNQKVERLIKIDGEIYFIFPKSKGKKLLKDVKKLDKLELKLNLKEEKISYLNDRIKLRDQRVKYLEDQVSDYRKLSYKMSKQVVNEKTNQKLWQKPGFQFAVGFISATAVYGLWQYTHSHK